MATDRFQVIAAGFQGDLAVARAALADADEKTRSSALRSLARQGQLTDDDLQTATRDTSVRVRRTAAELAATHPLVDIRALLDDPDVYVAEMAAWSIGERPDASVEEVDALVSATTGHGQQLVREAAAAALGSIGDERGLDAVIAACSDKPTVRRRAVLALAPFIDDERVQQVLQKALTDHDWQVRQNAEDLLHPRG